MRRGMPELVRGMKAVIRVVVALSRIGKVKK
ncbi:Uncharacterised protein [uncultured Clostridium sp.]